MRVEVPLGGDRGFARIISEVIFSLRPLGHQHGVLRPLASNPRDQSLYTGQTDLDAAYRFATRYRQERHFSLQLNPHAKESSSSEAATEVASCP
jgi:hypothetical protein